MTLAGSYECCELFSIAIRLWLPGARLPTGLD